MLSGVITLQWCKLEKHFLLLAVYITCALGFMENKFFVKTTWNPNPDTTLAQEWCPKSSSHSACVHTNATQGQGWCVWPSWVKSRTRGPPKKNLTNREKKKQSHWTASPAAVDAQPVSAARITQVIHMGVVHAQRPRGEALKAFVQSLLLTMPWQLRVALASAGLLLAVGRKDLRGSTLGNKSLQCLVWECKLNAQDKKSGWWKL